MKFILAQSTHNGKRITNEDYAAFKVTPSWTCLALADGLGGHMLGATAAQLIIDKIIDEAPLMANQINLNITSGVAQLIASAYLHYQKVIADQYDNQDARTTLAMCWINSQSWCAAFIGDSRIYHLSPYQPLWRTLDHSLVQLWVLNQQLNENKMSQHRLQHVILNSINIYHPATPEINAHPTLQVGEGILICSDGLWENTSDLEINKLLTSPHPQTALDDLVQKAFESGGPYCDNITGLFIKRIDSL